MKRLLAAGCMLLALTALCAQEMEEGKARLPQFFADGMVLQRSVPVPVWGWGRAGDRIVVEVAGRRAKTVVQADGTWRVTLPRLKAGGPYRMEVSASRAGAKPVVTFVTRIENVLVGDVFLCSGQSNMELPVRRCMDRVAPLVRDYRNGQIRYLKVPQQYNYVRPNDDLRVLPWQDIRPENCGEVSAVCYFMARRLQEEQGVPVGIVNSSVGGTKVDAWTPRGELLRHEGYAAELSARKYSQEDWVDSVSRLEWQAGEAWRLRMMEADTVAGRWREEGYDFSRWPLVDRFADWGRGQNGSYWFETEVDLPDALGGQPGVLRFGAIRDADSIFVNGTFVGNTTYQYPPRIYAVPAGVLRRGTNRIVVHLVSEQGTPGFVPQKRYQLEVAGSVFPLASQLRMAVGATMPPKPASTYFVDTPTGLYNAMIAPFADFPFRGILWYQGESNLSHTDTYADLLEGMTASWRRQFGRDLPLVVVQLPAYMGRHDAPVTETGWTRIRQQQLLASRRIPHAALVPTLDTGESVDVHPQEKDIVGARCATMMSRLAYGTRGPLDLAPAPLQRRRGGQGVRIAFPGGKLAAAPGTAVEGLALLTPSGWQHATARVADSRTLELDLPAATGGAPSPASGGGTASPSDARSATDGAPLTVRYGWDDFPTATLFYADGWPVPQFEVEIR